MRNQVDIAMQIKTIRAGSIEKLDERANEFLRGVPLSFIKKIELSTDYDSEDDSTSFTVLIAYTWTPADRYLK